MQTFTVTPTIIRKACRAAKLYAAINVPLKTKELTKAIKLRRYSRFTKLFINIFSKELAELSNNPAISLQGLFNDLWQGLGKDIDKED